MLHCSCRLSHSDDAFLCDGYVGFALQHSLLKRTLCFAKFSLSTILVEFFSAADIPDHGMIAICLARRLIDALLLIYDLPWNSFSAFAATATMLSAFSVMLEMFSC